jgi:glycosyltransferase involved in cell wall biosynthesis
MQENTIMIVPLLAGSGMRIKIIEGLALGKAIVSTSIGAEGIHAVHNESICIADSAQEFIDAVVLLIKKYELRCAIEKMQLHLFRQILIMQLLFQN